MALGRNEKGIGVALKFGLCLLLLTLLMPGSGRANCEVESLAGIPLQIVGGTILVPVQINGVTGSFVLDTGAQRSVVTPDAVNRLGLARDEWVGTTMSGVGGVDRRPNANPRSLTLGGVPLVRRTLSHDTSLTVAVLPNARAGSIVIDGLLGRDFLAQFDLDLDMPAHRLTLFRVSGCAGRFLPWAGNYATIPATVPAGDAIVVPVSIDGKDMRALLDTGASSSLIAAPGMYRLGLSEGGMAGDPSGQIGGVGPRLLTVRQHRFRSMRVGDQTLDSPAIWVEPVRLTPIVDMLLGGDWLAERHVWISYATRQLFVVMP